MTRCKSWPVWDREFHTLMRGKPIGEQARVLIYQNGVRAISNQVKAELPDWYNAHVDRQPTTQRRKP